MKRTLFAFAVVAALVSSASAQQYAAYEGYRVCTPAATNQGLEVVREQCGSLQAPNFAAVSISSESELKAYEAQREQFRSDVKVYGQCITQLINSYRRPGAPADSKVPDQAACAHSWAEDQATQSVRTFGKACIDFSNRSMMSPEIKPYDGACYPTAGTGRG